MAELNARTHGEFVREEDKALPLALIRANPNPVGRVEEAKTALVETSKIAELRLKDSITN